MGQSAEEDYARGGCVGRTKKEGGKLNEYYMSTLCGRRQIFSAAKEITANNVIKEVNEALAVHMKNCAEIDYLYWYRRGIQPILNRTKSVRPEINNKITENHAEEIVSFKNGYFLTEPAFYISRKDDEGVYEKVSRLNEYLYTSGKHEADCELVDWFHTVGIAPIIIQPNDSEDKPVEVFALDPRSAFVVYSRKVGNKPLFAVNIVIVDEKTALIDVFTDKNVYRIDGGYTQKDGALVTAKKIVAIEPNTVNYVPIVEYRYNSNGLGAFEAVIPLLDAINNVTSNRVDGIEQFIQSLAVATNCNFEEGVTANKIREAGMLLLTSTGENKADFKILSEQLNQSETQVFVNYLYQQVLTICGMPTTTKGGTSTSDTGAAVLARDGWYQADNVARNTEDLFKKSNKLFDEIFISILKRKIDFDISISDFEIQFVRNETANVLAKAQAASTMLSAGFAPELAFAKSGISNDPVSDVNVSRKYLQMIYGDPDAPKEKAKVDNVANVVDTAQGGV